MNAKILKALTLTLLLVLPGIAKAEPARVSIASDGSQANHDSSEPSVSEDGRFVAFSSSATNLAASDTNALTDVFVRDIQSGETTRVSVDSGGIEGNGSSSSPSISANGRYVAFESRAANLVASDTNGLTDIFVHDMQTGETSRVSIRTGGSEGDNWSYDPSINDDGRYVAFYSNASNLVASDTNSAKDAFVHDRQSGETIRVSVDSNGVEADSSSYDPQINGSGRYITFYSDASNLVAIDTNLINDVFVHDTQSGETTRVSVNNVGAESNSASQKPSISSDGRYVAFESGAELVSGDSNGRSDIFVHDRQSAEVIRVNLNSDGTQANGASGDPAISTDGRYVTFYSEATSLIDSDNNSQTDIFIHDIQSGKTARVSEKKDEGGGNTGGNNWSGFSIVSKDGAFVIFHSQASNLVSGDTNEKSDIFIAENPLPASATPTPTATATGSPTETPTPTPVDVPIYDPQKPKTKKEVKAIIRNQINPIVKNDKPGVAIKKKKAQITLLQFNVTQAEQVQQALEQIRLSAKKKLVVRYEVKIKSRKSNQRKISKRNTVSSRRLKPGKYNVRYRIKIKQGRKTVANSAWSSRTNFSLGR